MVRRVLRVLLFLTILCFVGTAGKAGKAVSEGSPLSAEVNVPDAGVVVIPLQHTESGEYLFLPSCVSLDALVLRFSAGSAILSGEKGSITVESGVPFSVLSIIDTDQSCFALNMKAGNERISFTLMHSSTLNTAFLTSGDEKQGRSYVEADKERKAKGASFALLRPDGTAIWSGSLKSIKGRGNSTWHYPKKPYQIKLSEKADLLETGDQSEKESTWILLANYIDESLLRNLISFDLAAEFQLPYTPHCASVDLYYDGEYRGVYLLCEKTEISKGRVSIRDLEGEIEKVNPEIKDYDGLTPAEGTLEGGLVYRYYPEIYAPEDLRGGYLLELDYGPRAMEETSWFCTESGQYVTVKSPEYTPEAGMRYIASLYQSFERAVFAGGIDPVSGKDYRELCDLDSLARCFLLMELAKDNDAFLSSTYFYKPEGEEMLFAGPVWDFDTGYGVAELPDDISVTARTVLGNRLLQIPSFRKALLNCWKELKPLVYDLLLSTDMRSEGYRLKNLIRYDNEIAASRQMDRALWGRTDHDRSIETLQAFLIHRAAWLEKQLKAWYAGEVPNRLFQDVDESQWFYESVEYVVEHGLFTGSSETQFEPFKSINRAMAVVVLHRLAGEPKAERHSSFQDVDPAAWYAAAVDWAMENEITAGTGKNRFAPGQTVTREQLITLLYRVIRNTGRGSEDRTELSAFSDADKVSPWAVEAMSWAVRSGILNGINGRLAPQGDVTRAQAAAIFTRAYQTFFDTDNAG